MRKRFLLCILSLTMVAAADAPLKIVITGIAQDGGIPHLGCNQKICKTQRHSVSSLAVVGKNSLFFFDATPDFREQYFSLAERYDMAQKRPIVDGIFLTHAHMGHYTGLMYLGKESISTRQVPVYCSKEMGDFLQNNAPWSLLVSNKNIELHPFESGDHLQFKDFTVTPLEVPHRREFTDTHGFVIRGAEKAALFIPDIDSWEGMDVKLATWLATSNYAFLDGTFYSGDELPGRDIRLVPHPTIVDSLKFLSTLPPFDCRIFFTHLNHTNPLLDPESKESITLKKTRYAVVQEWMEFPI